MQCYSRCSSASRHMHSLHSSTTLDMRLQVGAAVAQPDDTGAVLAVLLALPRTSEAKQGVFLPITLPLCCMYRCGMAAVFFVSDNRTAQCTCQTAACLSGNQAAIVQVITPSRYMYSKRYAMQAT